MSTRVEVSKGSGKVLVLGSGTGAFLSVVRSLGRGGLEVHVGWELPGAPALRSRYVHRFHAIPSYDRRSRDWITHLAAVMRRERFDLVIPTDQIGVRALLEHRTELERWGRLYGPSNQSFRLLSDKTQTAQLARSLGLRVPESRMVRDFTEGADLDSELGIPLELKHWSPDDPADRVIERLPQTASGRAEYHRLLEAMLQDGPVTVRQSIAGQLVGVGLLLDQGKLLLGLQYAHVHESPHEARGSYVASVPLAPELVEAALRLMETVAFTGVAVVEFRCDPATETWVMIDVSAGSWGSLPLALAAGANFPMGLYRLLVDGITPEPSAYRTGVHSRHLSGDVFWFLFKLRADGNEPMLTIRLLRDAVGELTRNLLLRREHFDAFSIDDPVPLMVELGQTLRKGFKLMKRRGKRRLAASTVVRRRLTQDALHAVRDAETVLFVCTGNICRSPFAEYRARALGIFPEVTSAGHDALENSRSPQLATKAAADWDVQLAPHRARRLVQAHVRAADVIFVFDEDNEQRLIDIYPFARDRVHYIGSLRAHGPLFVDDPFGGDLGVFKHSYAEIDDALSEMARLRGIRQGHQ